MSCGCNKNTTSEKVFAALKGAKIDFRSSVVKGIGIFVVPAPEHGVLEWKTVEVDDISYSECKKRGANCESFQWIPKGITTTAGDKSVTINSIADLSVLRDYCDDSCRGGCPMGCVCFNNEVVCHR
jgi:hypothetical protein